MGTGTLALPHFALGHGHWALGHWLFPIGPWDMGSGPLGHGLWAIGPWDMGSGRLMLCSSLEIRSYPGPWALCAALSGPPPSRDLWGHFPRKGSLGLVMLGISWPGPQGEVIRGPLGEF